MRRPVVFCALGVIASAVVARSLPPGANEPSGGATTAPLVITNNLPVRSLGLAEPPPAAYQSVNSSLYLTVSDSPNRLFALNPVALVGPASDPIVVASNLWLVAGVAQAGSLGDGGPASSAQLDLKLDSLLMRSGVAVASDATIFIADSGNSTIRRVAGSSSSEPGVIRSILGHWAPHQLIELIEPMGIALDHAGNLYVADHGANAVLVLHAATSELPGPAELLAHVAQPASISVTPDARRVFVASPETGTVFSIDAQTRAIIAVTGFVGRSSSCISAQASGVNSAGICAAGLATDGGGNLFVADAAANELLRYDSTTARISVVATQLSSPGEIAFDTAGDLFVADQGRNRIVQYQNLGQPLNTVTLSPSSNDFGVEPTGGISPPAPFTLTNGTSAELTSLVVNSFQGANPSDFQAQATSCTTTLPANSSCTINVVFEPRATAARSAQLMVSYTAGTNLTAALTGVGADFSIALAGTQNMSVTAVAGTTATYNLQLTTDGNFPANSPYTITFVAPPIASPIGPVAPPTDLPALTVPTFSPPSVTAMPDTTVPFTLTIQTTSRVTGDLGSIPGSLGDKVSPSGCLPLLAAFPLAALAVFMIARAAVSPRAQQIRLGSLAVLCLGIAGLIGGCGGHGKRATIGTPAGTTNFLIQATVQNAAGTSLNAARGFPLQLVVQ